MQKFLPRNLQTIAVALLVAGIIFLGFSGYLNTVTSSALSPVVGIQSWISSRYLAVVEFVTVPRDVATLRARNAELESQVFNLQARVVDLEQQLREAQVLYALLDFARSRPENQYVASAVIGRDPSPFLHYIFIDHGSDDGLRHGMPVVTEQGLVGRVDAVTARAARVQLITDPATVVNVRLQSQDVDVMLTGSITGDVNLGMIPQDMEMKPGELILTSGLGGSYPQDVVVGQVVSARKRENDLFQSASVQPVVDFRNLRAVLVITNFRPVDIGPLTPAQNP